MNFLTMLSGKGDLWVIPKSSLINFERMQETVTNNNNLIINTLTQDKQHCLITNTIHAKDEVNKVEKGLKENKYIKI